jgi:phosphopentomutase
MFKRVYLMVVDSLGIGGANDAERFGDGGSNTLGALRKSEFLSIPNLVKLGLYNIDGVLGGMETPIASYARLKEKSNGKDTTLGHWEIAGIVSNDPLPTYPNGFPSEIISEFEKQIFELFKNGKKAKEISSILNVNCKSVYNCIYRIKNKIIVK